MTALDTTEHPAATHGPAGRRGTGRPPTRLQDLLDDAAARRPDHTALVFEQRSCTFAQLRAASLVARDHLHRVGVRRTDRVVVVVDDLVDAIAYLFGAARLGAVYVLMNHDTTRRAADHVMGDCEPACVVTGADGAQARSAADLGIPVAAPDAFGHPEPERPADDPVISSDLASILYTSGSTGHPKGVVATHRNMIFAVRAIADRLRLREDDVIGCVLPPDFDYGAYHTFLSMISGATLVWGRGAAAGPGLLTFLTVHRVTVLPAVPGLSHNLDRLSRRNGRRLPPLRVVTNTGAAMSSDLVGRLQDRYPGLDVYLMFGLTECKRISILLPEELAERPESVGRPLDDTECLVVDEHGDVLPAGHAGELVVRGPHVMQGYWRAPEQTGLRFRPWGPHGERVLFTGDQCRIDEDGFLYFLGRDDDIYKSHDFRVSATEVTVAAEAVPGVVQACCLPGRDGAEPLLAVVTELTAAQVRTRLNEQLEWFKIPDRIVVTEAIPLGRNGKIDPEAVRALDPIGAAP